MTQPAHHQTEPSSSYPEPPEDTPPVTLLSVIHAELIKCYTLPSYPLTALMVLTLIVGMGLLNLFTLLGPEVSAGRASGSHQAPIYFAEFLNGMQNAYVVLAVLAVVFIASEYTQATIQPSALSTPTRLPILVAKMIVMGCTGLIIGVLASSILLLVVPAILSGANLTLSGSTEDVVRVVTGSGLSLGLIAVLAMGLAAVIRSLVTAFVTVVALLTVAPIVISAVPLEWVARMSIVLPTVAGSQYLSPDPTTALLDPWWGVVILTAWASASVVVGGLALRYRDV